VDGGVALAPESVEGRLMTVIAELGETLIGFIDLGRVGAEKG
jgi:hypothetical protein